MHRKRSARNELCILGIDVGGTSIRAGLFSPQAGSIRCVRAVRTEASRGGRHSLDRVATLAREVVAEGEAQGLRADRVGIGIPELVGMAGAVASRRFLKSRAGR